MGTPSPAIPSFTDGTVVHQSDLNALATNLTNLYAYNQAGFQTQRPAVVALQTVAQTLTTGGTGQLISFNSAAVNVGSMWIASQPQQITIQDAGMYYVFGSVAYPTFGGAGTTNIVGRADLMLNGTTPASNSVHCVDTIQLTAGIGCAPIAFYVANVAAGSTFFLAGLQTTGASQATRITFGGSFLAAFYIGSST